MYKQYQVIVDVCILYSSHASLEEAKECQAKLLNNNILSSIDVVYLDEDVKYNNGMY